jgi:hypothetical protein
VPLCAQPDLGGKPRKWVWSTFLNSGFPGLASIALGAALTYLTKSGAGNLNLQFRFSEPALGVPRHPAITCRWESCSYCGHSSQRHLGQARVSCGGRCSAWVPTPTGKLGVTIEALQGQHYGTKMLTKLGYIHSGSRTFRGVEV